MGQIEQNFETKAKPELIHELHKSRTPVWKILVIWVPVLVFMTLLLTIFIFGRNRSSSQTTSIPITPTPTTPTSSPFISNLIQIQNRISSLNLSQPQFEPPAIDLDINFE